MQMKGINALIHIKIKVGKSPTCNFKHAFWQIFFLFVIDLCGREGVIDALFE